MTIHQTFVGCDIGKEAVDILDPRTATRHSESGWSGQARP